MAKKKNQKSVAEDVGEVVLDTGMDAMPEVELKAENNDDVSLTVPEEELNGADYDDASWTVPEEELNGADYDDASWTVPEEELTDTEPDTEPETEVVVEALGVIGEAEESFKKVSEIIEDVSYAMVEKYGADGIAVVTSDNDTVHDLTEVLTDKVNEGVASLESLEQKIDKTIGNLEDAVTKKGGFTKRTNTRNVIDTWNGTYFT